MFLNDYVQVNSTVPRAKAKSKHATVSMMELENLAETVSKRRRQGKRPESVSPTVESVTGSGSSGAAPGPGPPSAEAVPGTSTHATESAPGSCIELIPDATAPEVPVGVEAYPGNEQVLSFDFDTNPIPIASVHNQKGLHASHAIENKIISKMYIAMALLLETQPGEQVRSLNLSPS
ncbi:hypothetical protein DPMN_057318 [Dreissena polymorpha]|uniref:Uncharacterized protein n=1 Tax=Dreissena polymorpha TaxID=45954 RepID=A0A9D4HDZ2_DREPO|nr:hypothetical protein DPMN_057318 [Dreissena polymorpha]